MRTRQEWPRIANQGLKSNKNTRLHPPLFNNPDRLMSRDWSRGGYPLDNDGEYARQIIGVKGQAGLAFVHRDLGRPEDCAVLLRIGRVELDQVEKLGDEFLSVDFSEPEKEEIDISYSSCGSSKSFDFSVERLCGSVGASVIKEIQDFQVMVLY